MNLKVNNDADVQALTQLASLQNPRSLLAILAEYINTYYEEDGTNVTININRSLLPESYRGNPSLFGIKLLAKNSQFEDSSGVTRDKQVVIKLLANRKPTNARYTQDKPSIKRTIKIWLGLNLSRTKKLKIPIDGIPPFFFSHPEQLTYQIKRETNTPIKIIKHTTSWRIARK